LAIAVERRRALVDTHDQPDAALQLLVGEADALADAEVGTAGDLRGRPARTRIRFFACSVRAARL
jgi:hypothetical protein